MPDTNVTWNTWLSSINAFDQLVKLPDELGGALFQPTPADQQGAWLLYTEIESRISIQPLHYRTGDEATALSSLHSLFQTTRKLVAAQGAEGRCFTTIALYVLNTHVRPLTAKWHKKMSHGHLHHDDACREFRRELTALQFKLVAFGRLLYCLAADLPGKMDVFALTDNDSAKGQVFYLGGDIPFDRILSDRDDGICDELYTAEYESIAERRNSDGEVTNLAGLACSGGGIRSATFCLGVGQALARRGVLAEVDYLSTVSGGGYFGAFLSSYLNDSDRQQVGLEAGKLPLGVDGDQEPAPVRSLRNNSKYLLKGGLLGKARMAGLMLYGIFVNIVAVMAVLFMVLGLAKLAAHMGLSSERFNELVVMGISGLSAVVLSMVLALPFIYKKYRLEKERVRQYETVAICSALGIVMIAVLYLALPRLYAVLETLTGGNLQVLVVLFLVTAATAVLTMRAGLNSRLGRVLVLFLSLSGPLLLLMTFMVLDDVIAPTIPWVMGLVVASIVMTAWLSLVNVNQVSPHRYYRNRLAETYLQRRGEAKEVDPQPLSHLQSNNLQVPYHLINATINLPNSEEPGLRGRGADFFLFSRHYCGSPHTGYCGTKALERVDPHLDLGTAMAASGAAASSFMGTNTIRGLSFWLSLLNIRLAYWLPNPMRVTEMAGQAYASPFSLWRELFGKMDGKREFVNISDGGHIENLGVYELLRRRCKFIIAIDAEADPTMSFSSLIKLTRYAHIDLGINLDIDLDDLRPNELGNTRAHYALGTIDYGKGDTGYLLYIKSSMTGNEKEYVLDYKKRHPSFPHETTADQFFNEAQFEAYRSLGEHAAEDLFHREFIGDGCGMGLKSLFESWAAVLMPEENGGGGPVARGESG
ncbi:MAG: hypothetical protein RPU32_13800 [Candidatus Sedimenticola sp. (ex Thyasira tokunagai)]